MDRREETFKNLLAAVEKYQRHQRQGTGHPKDRHEIEGRARELTKAIDNEKWMGW